MTFFGKRSPRLVELENRNAVLEDANGYLRLRIKILKGEILELQGQVASLSVERKRLEEVCRKAKK